MKMRTLVATIAAGMIVLTATPSSAEEAWQRDTPQEAANKKLVLEFWRVVYEAHHVELADKYLSPEYKQHNPNIPSGRDAIVKVLGRTGPIPIRPTLMLAPMMTIAKGDLVIMVFERQRLDPGDKTKIQTWYGYDMLRVAHDRIVEHWDGIMPAPSGTPYVSPPPPWVRYEQQKNLKAEQEAAIEAKKHEEPTGK